MSDVFEGGGFNAKVVNDEAEHDVAPHVPPEAGGVLTMIIPFGVKRFWRNLLDKMPAWGRPHMPIWIST